VEGRGKEAAVDTKWEAVQNKVRKAMFETFHTHQEALAAIDPESGGACFFYFKIVLAFFPPFFSETHQEARFAAAIDRESGGAFCVSAL
jgi:hypothetical protein